MPGVFEAPAVIEDPTYGRPEQSSDFIGLDEVSFASSPVSRGTSQQIGRR